ncbi:hypothetical protein CASFOL_037178 [Castilleja foliolosa]|uniref:PB1 domain-containing protein n=1 Tax=Castilleja foliolosa TaxID=1961234 RepID=A0ABD3BNE5_9LAMI
MEQQLPPPASATTAAAVTATNTSPRPPIAPSKLRLMCSYGGHIVPRPHDKSLFYAGGDSRIVAVDRRTTAASLSVFSAHLSRALFSNRLFHLKYQLPNEDLDSLISVITDEDLTIMIEEHDRVAPPARIRLFLFPVKPESVGSALLDPKSETWFSDALKSTGILQKTRSEDCDLLMGTGPDLEAHVESGSNSGGTEGKLGAESLVLETSSSFGSTCSSFSMSNSPPIGINQCDEKGLNLLDRKIRVPSSASIESTQLMLNVLHSEPSLVSLSAPPKPVVFQEPPLIQIGPDEPSENPTSDPSFDIATPKSLQVLGYPLSQLPDEKNQQPETQLIQGAFQYLPRYPGPMPISPYYPVYQMPIHPQHIPYHPNQPYPIYLIPIRPSQYPNMPMPFNSLDANAQTAKEVFGAQIAEPASKVYPAATQLVGVPSNQGQVVVGPTEPQIASETKATASVGGELDEDIVYNQIYKTQPLPPVMPTQYQTTTKGTGMLVDPPSVQVQQNKV